MFSDTVHHLWLAPDSFEEFVTVRAACNPDVTRIVARRVYLAGDIDPHFTSTDLCATCAQISVSA